MKEYISNNYASYEGDGIELLRTDRNGTRYYIDHKCPKCGGTGNIWYYGHIEGGVCFLCEGTGIKPHPFKVMTPEYAAILADRRNRKLRAKAPEMNRSFLTEAGLSDSGSAFIVLGDTFSRKDELKEAGAKFTRMLGWYFPEAKEGYETEELSRDVILREDGNGVYSWTLDNLAVEDTVKALQDAYKARNSVSEFVGEKGKRLELSLTCKRIGSFETRYSYYGETQYVFTFTDEAGNLFVWKTSSPPDIEEGMELRLKGTVKDHSLYKGEKQTVLTRCKLL